MYICVTFPIAGILKDQVFQPVFDLEIPADIASLLTGENPSEAPLPLFEPLMVQVTPHEPSSSELPTSSDLHSCQPAKSQDKPR